MSAGHPGKPVPIDDACARDGALFRAARTKSGHTLPEAAAAIGCSVNVVRWHEAGARMLRLDDIRRSAIFFKVKPQSLIG